MKEIQIIYTVKSMTKVFQCDLTNKSNAEIAQAIHDTFVNEYGYDLNDTIILTINAMALNKSASEMLQMIQSGEISFEDAEESSQVTTHDIPEPVVEVADFESSFADAIDAEFKEVDTSLSEKLSEVQSETVDTDSGDETDLSSTLSAKSQHDSKYMTTDFSKDIPDDVLINRIGINKISPAVEFKFIRDLLIENPTLFTNVILVVRGKSSLTARRKQSVADKNNLDVAQLDNYVQHYVEMDDTKLTIFEFKLGESSEDVEIVDETKAEQKDTSYHDQAIQAANDLFDQNAQANQEIIGTVEKIEVVDPFTQAAQETTEVVEQVDPFAQTAQESTETVEQVDPFASQPVVEETNDSSVEVEQTETVQPFNPVDVPSIDNFAFEDVVTDPVAASETVPNVSDLDQMFSSPFDMLDGNTIKIRELRTEIETLKQHLTAGRQLNEHLQGQLTEANKILENGSIQYNNVVQQLNTANQTITENNSEIESLKNNVSQLTVQSTQLSTQLQEKTSQLDALVLTIPDNIKQKLDYEKQKLQSSDQKTLYVLQLSDAARNNTAGLTPEIVALAQELRTNVDLFNDAVQYLLR
jgi:hypothetical protein